MSSSVFENVARNSNNPHFDIQSGGQQSHRHTAKHENNIAVVPSDDHYNPEVDPKITAPIRHWDPLVHSQVSSKQWLIQNGLKKHRLDSMSVFPQLGFRQVHNFDKILKKSVTSKYGEDLFVKQFRPDGSTYNITARKEQLEQYCHRLEDIIKLYQSRLDWLTTESRRIFGVIEEPAIIILIDIKNLSPRMFDQYLCALERVIKEQVARVAKFNLIRCCTDQIKYAEACVPVTTDSIQLAIDWIWGLDRLAASSASDTVEGLMYASNDPTVESVYLFTEGTSSDGAREVLRGKAQTFKLPLHVVSYNCSNKETLEYLKSLCVYTGGRFHAYAITLEMDSFECMPLDEDNKANIVVRRKTYGGVPAGSGVRQDCLEIFDELEEAKQMLTQITDIINQTPDTKALYDTSVEHDDKEAHQRKEEYMSSLEWVTIHGIKPRKLDFYDLLAGVSFKHCDGVVDVMGPPDEEEVDLAEQQNAVVHPKLVNAKYCDKFAHVRWKDGGLVHVQLSPEIHRHYDKRMQVAIDAITKRIDFLRQGSRELFGTIVEDQIYILIDTSASMEPSIGFVKDKLFVLMQEQLRHKKKVNFVAFNTKSTPWKDRMVDVTETNLQAGWLWIKSLTCYGSTNTMAALQFALSDRHTHAVYLLTDGRPDHPAKTVLAQVQLHHRIPIHTISFNCSDKEANTFLCTLSKETGGRFHYFSEAAEDAEAPEPWESEDIRVLKEELNLCNKYIEQVTSLRDECHRLAWNRDTNDKENPSSNQNPPKTRKNSREYQGLPHAKHRQRTPTAAGRRRKKKEQRVPIGRASVPPLKLHQDPSKESRLRGMSRDNKEEDWLLPETKEVLDRQDARYAKKVQDEERQYKESLKASQPSNHGKKREPKGIRPFLKVFGLVPQKMTILDALGPTIVQQKPEYIEVLDKTVLSRVFDDILPVAHISNKDKRTLRLVNPLAVDLTGYTEKLSALIQRYENKYLSISTEALPVEVMNGLLDGTDNSQLVYEEHFDLINEALEKAQWPVEELDMELLRKEIETAKKYLRQAEELSKLRSAPPKRPDPITYEGFGEILQSSRGGAEATKKNGKASLDTLRGQRVIARDEKDGFYYAGSVVQCPDVRTAEVQYYDKKKSIMVPVRFCIPISGAIARPSLMVGDCVLARVSNRDNDRVGYVPGKVSDLPRNAPGDQRVFGIRFFNGTQHMMARGDIVKIGESRHNFTVHSIVAKAGTSARELSDSDSDDSQWAGSKKGDEREAPQFSVNNRRGERVVGSDPRLAGLLKTQSEKMTEMDHRHQDETEQLRRQQRKLQKKLFQMKKERRDSTSQQRLDDKLEQHEKQITKLKEDLKREHTLLVEEKKKAKSKRKLRRKSSDSSLSHDKSPLKNSTKDRPRSPESTQTKSSKQESRHSRRSPSPDYTSVRSKDSRSQSRQESTAEVAKRKDSQLRQRSSSREDEERSVQERSERSRSLQSQPKGKSPPRSKKSFSSSPNKSEDGRGSRKLKSVVEVKLIGEEVLVRWMDDGWYYRGIVTDITDEELYVVEDAGGNKTTATLEDIVTEDGDRDVNLEEGNTVLGMHPDYASSYAPAVVLKITGSLRYSVRFYDGVEIQLPREECYYVVESLFDQLVNYITDAEEKWVGQSVVARNDDTGAFQMGEVKKRVGSGKQYVLEWADGSHGVQSANYIFGALTRQHDLKSGDRVLACADRSLLLYLPGWITRVDKTSGKLTVKFCDGSSLTQVDPVHTFWLSQEFYNKVVAYVRKQNKKN